ncbi:hypothetical protein [Sphingosinicella sp. CPCC 101087]|uniref:hypothetical protein n=1 Tax=Sphingosinicella sp. CPCC 101087 TaxID=2497754 RepID=UPI00101C07D0|nr:hypothetical protein [Sphingosinicella sp. CPCC 101087]
MQLIEILLPLRDKEGRPFDPTIWAQVREELIDKFGGLTAFTREPAEGLWEENGRRDKDEIVILEVMAETLDRNWWRTYREELERRFRQDEIVLRGREIERF